MKHTILLLFVLLCLSPIVTQAQTCDLPVGTQLTVLATPAREGAGGVTISCGGPKTFNPDGAIGMCLDFNLDIPANGQTYEVTTAAGAGLTATEAARIERMHEAYIDPTLTGTYNVARILYSLQHAVWTITNPGFTSSCSGQVDTNVRDIILTESDTGGSYTEQNVLYLLPIGDQVGEDQPFIIPCTGELPVELGLFEGTVDGTDVLLRWGTLSETNNAGFEVQHRSLDTANKAAWQTLHFVDGFGTTIQPQDYTFRASGLAPGTHVFRLKQLDYDGAFDFSPEVEVIIDLAETYMIEAAYPNPFNPESTMRFAVQQAQHVEVALFNTLGQQVQTLFTGMAEAGQMQQVTIDGSDLPSGMYLVRVVGERFAETQTVTLLK